MKKLTKLQLLEFQQQFLIQTLLMVEDKIKEITELSDLTKKVHQTLTLIAK